VQHNLDERRMLMDRRRCGAAGGCEDAKAESYDKVKRSRNAFETLTLE